MKKSCLFTILLLTTVSFSYGGQKPPFLDLVEMYKRGEYEDALKGFRALAEDGDVAAQYNLGVMYLNGQGTKYSEADALRWFTKAAEQGNIDAQYNVAAMYINGTGIPRDYVRAYKWFSVLASQGVKGSQVTVNQLTKLMTPAQLQEAKRLYRDWVTNCAARDCGSTVGEAATIERPMGITPTMPPFVPLTGTQATTEATSNKHGTEKLHSARPGTAPDRHPVTRRNTSGGDDRTSQRLAELESLYHERLISPDEYRSIRQRILRGQ